MEDTLRERIYFHVEIISVRVLILVLMEDTLREANGSGTFFYLKNGLNPCSNGRYSQSSQVGAVNETNVCLNPCSNGRYSQRVSDAAQLNELFVLILVLMEDTLRDTANLLNNDLDMS